MEFDIVPQVIIVLSMGIIILILGRNISKVKETPDDFLFENKDEEKEKEKFLYLCKRLTRRVNKEKYQEKVGLFWVWFEKVLRKLRINFLRLDNKIVSTLDKVKEKNVENVENVENETEIENKDQQQEFNRPRNDKEENIYADDKNKEDKLNAENKKGKEKEYIDLILKNPVDIKTTTVPSAIPETATNPSIGIFRAKHVSITSMD